jgi:hypothetical protein
MTPSNTGYITKWEADNADKLLCTCRVCLNESIHVAVISVYYPQSRGGGIRLCPNCQSLLEKYRSMPYSKLMDKIALLETGYYINRKQAAAHRQLCDHRPKFQPIPDKANVMTTITFNPRHIKITDPTPWRHAKESAKGGYHV